MKRIVAILVVVGFCLSVSLVQAAEPYSVAWYEAKYHLYEWKIVCGPVMGATYVSASSGQPTFLNVGADYPNPDRFTVVIWGRDRYRFAVPPETAYHDRYICTLGWIEPYQGRPEIQLSDPNNITVW